MPQWNSSKTKRNRVLLFAIGAMVLLLAALAVFVFSRIRAE